MWHEWSDWCHQNLGREHWKCASFSRPSSPFVVFVWEGLRTRLHQALPVNKDDHLSQKEGFGHCVGYTRRISDVELLQQFHREMPNMGETLVIGRLRSLGYVITRQRVRDAIHATDPLNTLFRWRGILTSWRPYLVPSPYSLWHIGIDVKLFRLHTLPLF